MRLEHSRNLTIGEHLAYRRDCSLQLLRMVSIVIHIDLTRGVDIELEATFHTRILLQTASQLLLVKHLATRACRTPHRGHCRHRIFDIHPTRNTQTTTLDNARRSHYIVVIIPSLAESYIFSIKIARCIVTVSPDINPCRRQRDIDTLLDYQVTTLLDKRRELPKGLDYSLKRTVYIQVVSRHSRNDRHIGFQAQERAVKFVGLNSQTITLAQNHITVKILRYSTQESIATHIGCGIKPRYECRSCGLAVSTRYGHHILALREMPQHLRAFLHQETVLTEELHLRMVARHSRSKDNHRGCVITKRRGDILHSILITHRSTLLLKGRCQRCRRTVITRNSLTLVHKVTGQGTHTDAANAHKIYVVVVLHFILLFTNKHTRYT